MSAPVLLVLGMVGGTPFAGVAWQLLHYLEGFRRLGFEVYYLEDTGAWPYHPERNTVTDDCRYTVRYIARLMDWCGLPDRWAYRSGATGELFGLSEAELGNLLGRAEALVNLTGATLLHDEHLRVPIRIYLETDPVLPQIEVAMERRFTIDLLEAHTHHFSFGENLGAPGCRVPVTRFDYMPTRQPVVLEWWSRGGESPGRPFTTVANWKQSGRDVVWKGQTYHWSKHHEFVKFLDLPRRLALPLELALACGDPGAVAMLRSRGWRVVDAMPLSLWIEPYRAYILSSGGEFTVAKDQNIRLKSGWFSDRSACYLAAGLPVVTQDTGFGAALPTGWGLFTFRTMDDVLDAFEQIAADFELHSWAAREIAGEYFRAERVLTSVLDRVGMPVPQMR